MLLFTLLLVDSSDLSTHKYVDDGVYGVQQDAKEDEGSDAPVLVLRNRVSGLLFLEAQPGVLPYPGLDQEAAVGGFLDSPRPSTHVPCQTRPGIGRESGTNIDEMLMFTNIS